MAPCDTLSKCEAALDYCFIGGPLFLKCPHFQASEVGFHISGLIALGVGLYPS